LNSKRRREYPVQGGDALCVHGLRVIFLQMASILTPNPGRRALEPRLHTPHVCLNVHATTPRFAGVSPCGGQRDSRDSPWMLEEGNQLCMGGSDTGTAVCVRTKKSFSFSLFLFRMYDLQKDPEQKTKEQTNSPRISQHDTPVSKPPLTVISLGPRSPASLVAPRSMQALGPQIAPDHRTQPPSPIDWSLGSSISSIFTAFVCRLPTDMHPLGLKPQATFRSFFCDCSRWVGDDTGRTYLSRFGWLVVCCCCYRRRCCCVAAHPRSIRTLTRVALAVVILSHSGGCVRVALSTVLGPRGRVCGVRA
jgi:hypothetical protein